MRTETVHTTRRITENGRKIRGPVQMTLELVAEILKKYPDRAFLYTVWEACGKPDTLKRDQPASVHYRRTLGVLAEASGIGEVGKEHLSAAIGLAGEKGL